MTRLGFGVALGFICASTSVQAQPSTPAAIPVRQLHTLAQSDTSTLRGVAATRVLPNGGVIVNDAAKRQLVVYDSTLSHAMVIADTSSIGEYSYGLTAKAGGLIPYVADSTMFADNESSFLLVINPDAKIVNVIAPVRGKDLTYITGGIYGASGFDTKGRLIYGSIRYKDVYQNLPGIGEGSKIATLADSAPILRADFDERTVDTVAMIKVPVQKSALERTPNGGVMTTTVYNPLPSGDDWTILPDGTIAIVRVQDYHIDWISADGKFTSSPKMPFDWRSISQQDKKLMIDSVKHGLDEASAKDFAEHPPLPGTAPTVRLNFTVDESDIPDFFPPVRQHTTRADMNGRVWILPSTSVAARSGLLYDVVNRQGEIEERVQLPPGRALVGFGRGNIVYVSNIKSPASAVLERAEIVR